MIYSIFSYDNSKRTRMERLKRVGNYVSKRINKVLKNTKKRRCTYSGNTFHDHCLEYLLENATRDQLLEAKADALSKPSGMTMLLEEKSSLEIEMALILVKP